MPRFDISQEHPLKFFCGQQLSNGLRWIANWEQTALNADGSDHCKFEDQKTFSVTEISITSPHDARAAIVSSLRRAKLKARFITELLASLSRSGFAPEQTNRALGELETDGVIMIREHFCADPHLAGTDLRVAALVESVENADPQLSAIRAIDETWNKWLNEYLANHRCG